MIRFFLVAFAGLALLAAPASASWSDGLFDQPNHDFGSVPRGPLLTHYYRVTNNTAGPVRIVGVRVSCGCVSASALQGEIAPGQSTAILAQMDTRRFAGSKQVTIYVTFDRPQWVEARLSISAYGRDDFTLDPDAMTFGTVTRGATGNTRMTVTLRQPQWAVQSATATSGFVVPEVKELRRTSVDVVYEISANLRPGLPVGRWTTEVVLTTNSPVAPTIRVPATVEVAPALTASPEEIKLGNVAVGTPAEAKVLIRGGQPFKIKEIQGVDGVISAVPAADEARPMHLVTVKLDPKTAGDFARKLRVVTDLPNEGFVDVAVKAQVNDK